MPLLKSEPTLFPTEIFALDVKTSPWQVAHVRSRQEKSLARRLHAVSGPYFLPQVTKLTHRSGREFVSHLPLIPGYLFFRGAAEVADQALRSGVVVQILKVEDQSQLNEELCQIHQLLSSGARFMLEDRFSPGDQVLIKTGSFSGYRGVVVDEGRRARLIVTITMLQKHVSVEFDPAALARDGSKGRFRFDRGARTQ